MFGANSTNWQAAKRSGKELKTPSLDHAIYCFGPKTMRWRRLHIALLGLMVSATSSFAEAPRFPHRERIALSLPTLEPFFERIVRGA